MQLLSHGAKYDMATIFRVSHIFQNNNKIWETEKNICQYCSRERAITTLLLNTCWNQI